MLKPFNRAKAPIDEPNLVNPRESISPSVLEYDLAFRRAPPYVVLKKSSTWGNPKTGFFAFKLKYCFSGGGMLFFSP
jgi:hypothetical protein